METGQPLIAGASDSGNNALNWLTTLEISAIFALSSLVVISAIGFSKVTVETPSSSSSSAAAAAAASSSSSVTSSASSSVTSSKAKVVKVLSV